jgi:hypothetical protein
LQPLPKINPEILRWARETAGLSLTEAASKLRIKKARGISPVDRLRDLWHAMRSPRAKEKGRIKRIAV